VKFSTIDRSSLILVSKTTVLVLACLMVYWQDFTILINDAILDELSNYILAIPFLIIYSIYRKRRVLRTVAALENKGTPIHNEEIIGLIICVLSFMIYWDGTYTFNPLEVHMITLPIFITGLILLIFNLETLKTLAFPVFFTIFLTPLPLEMAYTIGALLSDFSSKAAFSIAKTLGFPVTLSVLNDSPVINLINISGKSITFAVEIACSGLYSLTGFAIFACFAGHLMTGPASKRIITSLLGFPLIYIMNILRICLIIIIGFWFGQEAAVGTFHLLGGWVLIFLGTFGLFVFAEKIWKIKIFTNKLDISACSYCTNNLENKPNFCPACGRLFREPGAELSKKGVIKLVTILTLAYLVMSISVPIFAMTEGPLEIIIQSPHSEKIASILPTMPGYRSEYLFRDKDFEKLYGQDATLTYAYISENGTEAPIFITFEVSGSQRNLHKWEVCYAMSSMVGKVSIYDVKDTQLSQNPPIIGRFLKVDFLLQNSTQNILYWYEKISLNTDTGLESKYAKISVIVYSPDAHYVVQEDIERTLQFFANQTIEYWNPLKYPSLLTTAWVEIVRQRYPLMITLSGILSLVFASNIIGIWRERQKNFEFYNKLHDEDKLILKIVRQKGKEGELTTNTIATIYEKTTGKPIKHDLLQKKLENAEEIGLIKRKIANYNNNPILLWKAKIPSKVQGLISNTTNQ
jgi:exosortase